MTIDRGRHTLFLSQHIPTREEGTAMTAARGGYGRVVGRVKGLLRGAHATIVVAVAWAVLNLVATQ